MRWKCKGLKCKHSVNIADAWTAQQNETQEKENKLPGQSVQKGLCLARNHLPSTVKYIVLYFATFPRRLQQGKDQRKGQRCHRQQRRAVKPVFLRRETLTSAANASRLQTGGDAPPLQRLKDERAKKTKAGTAAERSSARTNSGRRAPSARKAEAPSSPMTTVIRFYLWSISLETWTLCR